MIYLVKTKVNISLDFVSHYFCHYAYSHVYSLYPCHLICSHSSCKFHSECFSHRDTFPVQLLLKTSNKFIVVRVTSTDLRFAKFEDFSRLGAKVKSSVQKKKKVEKCKPLG